MNRRYYETFDLMRIALMGCIVIAYFGLPTKYGGLAAPMFHFATAAMFTIYGYLVLRDGADLTRNIKRAGIATGIFFVFALAMTIGYMLYNHIELSLLFTKRAIFSVVVLNNWPLMIASQLWMVQSVFYALIVFYVLRRFKRFDTAACIVLMILGVLIGELAGVIHFSFLGYSVIGGNFLTRTMPYMLLGREIHKRRRSYEKSSGSKWLLLFILGLVLALGELMLLMKMDALVYSNHMIGFIMMSWAVCAWGTTKPHYGFDDRLLLTLGPSAYRVMYYIYNPIGVLYQIVCAIQGNEDALQYCGLITLGVTIVIAFLIAMLSGGIISDGLDKMERKSKTFKI